VDDLILAVERDDQPDIRRRGDGLGFEPRLAELLVADPRQELGGLVAHN
jgi:hypothetical protein